MDEETDTDDLEIGRITITRTLGHDGTDNVQVIPSDGLSMVEALGMIELSKDTLIVTRMFSVDAFDDEDDDEA